MSQLGLNGVSCAESRDEKMKVPLKPGPNDRAPAVAAAGEGPQNVDRRCGRDWKLAIALAQILEAGLVDDFGPEDLGIANLHGVFRGLRIVGLRFKIELSDSVVVLRVAEILVARRQRVVLADLVVQTRAGVGAVSRVRYRIGKGNGATNVGGIEDQGIDGRKVIDIPPLEIKKEGSFLAKRAAKVSVVLGRIVARFRTSEGVGGIKSRIISFDEKLSVIFVGARLGEDFNAAVAQLVVFRGKRVLIDPDFANG